MDTTATRRPSRLVRFGLGALAVLLALGTTALIGVVGLISWQSRPYEMAPAPPTAAAATEIARRPPPVLDPGRPTVAIVVGSRGAEIGDVMGPYDTLASSGAVNVLTVAPVTSPVPLTGGLDLVPDLTFDQLDALLARSGTGLAAIVVPAMPDVGEPSNQAVRDWLRASRDSTPIVLSICYGAGVAGTAGLLDGHTATSHWYRMPSLRTEYPQVTWRDGTRWVDDGGLISTGGILSGIDGALHLLERLDGTAAAARAAEQIGWRHYRPGGSTDIPRSALEPQDAAVTLLNAGFRWDRPRIGVLVTGGVGELELASAFDPYGGQSFAAQTLAVGDGEGPVTTRHGLTVLPRADLAGARGRLDRLLVPGVEAARQSSAISERAGAAGLDAEFLHEREGFPFDAALTDLARTVDVPTARWTAKVMEYPAGDLDLRGPSLPWSLVAWPIAITLALVVVLFQIPHGLRILRRARART